MKIVNAVPEPTPPPAPKKFGDMIGKVFAFDGNIHVLMKSNYDPENQCQWVNLSRNQIGGLIYNHQTFPNTYRELPNAKLVV